MDTVRFGINGDWRSVAATLCLLVIFVFIPITINERVGFSNIVEALNSSNESNVNPYYSENENNGQVAGVSTQNTTAASQKAKFLTLPIINTRIEVTEENLLIFSIATLSVILFIMVYIVLTLLENKNKEEVLEAGIEVQPLSPEF